MGRAAAILISGAALALATAAAAQTTAGDRYGPSAAAPLYAPALSAAPQLAPPHAAPEAPALRPLLSWPGKGATAPRTPVTTAAYPPVARPAARAWTAGTGGGRPVARPTFQAQPSATAMAAPPQPYFVAPHPQTPPPASTSLSPPPGWTAAPGPTASAYPAPVPPVVPSAPPRPQVAYAAAAVANPMPTSPPRPAAQPGDPRTRFYSVAREYGMQPDPVPIPPQFFAATPDLSAPETPDPALARSGTAASKSDVNAARLAANASGG